MGIRINCAAVPRLRHSGWFKYIDLCVGIEDSQFDQEWPSRLSLSHPNGSMKVLPDTAVRYRCSYSVTCKRCRLTWWFSMDPDDRGSDRPIRSVKWTRKWFFETEKTWCLCAKYDDVEEKKWPMQRKPSSKIERYLRRQFLTSLFDSSS